MQAYQIVLLVVCIIVVLYLLFTLAVSFYMINILVHPKSRIPEEALKWGIEHNRIKKENIEELYKHEEYTLKSNYGYDLNCMYIPSQVKKEFKDGKERVIVCVHGWTSDHYAMSIYGDLYLKLGFHVFLYDHRNHCGSGKAPTTMGDAEADDLELVIQDIKKRFNNNVVIGTQGESMGSGTVMIHAGRYQSIDFVVEDCGYSSLKDLLYYQCRVVNHLPDVPTVFFGRFAFRIMSKSCYGRVNPIKEVEKCENIPMYFVHGEADTFVPTKMVYKLYDAKKGYRKMTTYPNSIHAFSVVDHPEEYFKNLNDFLVEAKIIEND